MWKSLLCSAALVVFILSSCSEKSKKPQMSAPQPTLRLAITENFTSIDPRKARSLCTINLIKNTFEGLTRYTAEEKIEYALAHDVIISPDGKTYTITLKPAKWSDGKPVTAYDFEFSFKSSLSPATHAPNAYQLFVIKNGQAFFEGKCHPDALGVVAIDENTLEITLETPIPYFLELLAFHPFFPVPKHFFEDSHDFETQNPVDVPTNGPFVIASWQPNREVILKKNKEYRDSVKVQLEKVVYNYLDDSTALQMFEKGELDWIGAPTANLPTDALKTLRESKKLISSPAAITQFIRCNTSNPYLSNKKLRRALSLACNRRGLTDHALQAGYKPACAFVPPSFCISKNDYFPEQDIVASQKLYKEALSELKISQPSLSLMYVSSELSNKMVQVIQQSIKEALNLDITLEPVEAKIFFERMGKKSYVLALGRWSADFHDPINFLSIFQSKSNGTNNTEWESATYAQLLVNSNNARNKKERLQCLESAEKILMDEMPIIPLFYYTNNYLKSSKVYNDHLQSLGILELRDVKIK